MPSFDDDDSVNNNLPDDAEDFNFESMQDVEANKLGASEKEILDSSVNLGMGQADNTITAQPVKFASFEDLDSASGTLNQNLGILLDVKLQLTVELGKTQLPIKKVLELTKGSVVTLDKVAGEPVELYANGKLIAHGEVVVIEDNFGLRITQITPPVKRLDTFSQLPHETSTPKV